MSLLIGIILFSALLIYLALKLLKSVPAKPFREELRDPLEKLVEETGTPVEEAPEVFEHSFELQCLYLAREGALDQFENNADVELHEDITIGSAFTWSLSPEGHDYWSKISQGYESFLQGIEE